MITIFPEHRDTLVGTTTEVKIGRRTCLDVLDNCIGRIEEWEPKVHAWAYLDLESAREVARHRDRELAQGHDRGPLHGIPLGVKDIIDVAGMPTTAGFAPWADHIPALDAPIVTRLRDAGAIILGKTVTTPFAWIDPPRTCNPWDLERTPGGSSSGSAAAVATGMCLGAIGSQTGGSIIRPASFCGICGFKPEFGKVDTIGVVPFSPSLDHVGPMARSVEDLAHLYRCLEGSGLGGSVASGFFRDAPVLGRLGGIFEEAAEPSMRAACRETLDLLNRAGARVIDLALPPRFEDLHRDVRRIMASEAAAERRDVREKFPDLLAPRIRALIEEGRATSAPDYILALRHQLEFAAQVDRLFLEGIDAIVTPATIGPAPDRTTTGDPIFNSPWSCSGHPVVSIPVAVSPEGLPLAIQFTGKKGSPDLAVLEIAQWCRVKLIQAAFDQ